MPAGSAADRAAANQEEKRHDIDILSWFPPRKTPDHDNTIWPGGRKTMRPERAIMEMAGYYTSQALVDASSGERLMPTIGYLYEDGTRSIERIDACADAAVSLAEKKFHSGDPSVQGVILIKDGLVTTDGGTTDCMIMDIRFSQDEKQKIQYLQPYRHSHSHEGFAIYPIKFTEIEGFSPNCAQTLIQALFEGMEDHCEGTLLKASHYVDAIPSCETPYYAAEGKHDDYGLTSEEFACLQLAPMLIFSIMARVHGKLTAKKYEAFGRMLFNAQHTHSPVFEKIASATIGNIEALMLRQMPGGHNVLDNINAIRRITDTRLSAEDALGFKKALLLLGYEIAKASDSVFWFRRPLTRKQRKVLQGIADCLEVA